MLSTILNRDSLKWILITFVSCLIVYIAIGIFWVPYYVEGKLSNFLRERYGLTTHANSSSFNPFTFNYGIAQLRLNHDETTLLAAKAISVNFDPLALLYREGYTFGHIIIDSPELLVRRNASGQLNLVEVLSSNTVKSNSRQQALESGLNVSVDLFRVTGGSVSYEEQRLERNSTINVRDLSFESYSLNYPPRGQAPFNLALTVGDGHFRAEGTLDGDQSFSTKYSIEGLALSILNKLFPRKVPGQFSGGLLTSQGRITARLDGSDLVMESSGNVRNLELSNEQVQPMLSVSSIRLDRAQLKLNKPDLKLEGLTVERPEFNLIRNSEGRLNIQPFQEIIQTNSNDTGTDNDWSGSIRIGPTRINSGQFTFQDQALGQEVRSRIENISGTAGVVTNTPGNTVAVSARATVAGEAPIHSRAIVSPRVPEETMDLTTKLRELSLSPFSPYSVKYLGHRIDGGKLNLSLDYKIRNALLTGSNEITLDRFTLGKQVNDSPVMSAPVELAVGLLKDQNGQINVSIPVEGNLRAPEFQLQRMINQAIGNSIGKIVTSPFSFLAGMVGADASDLRTIKFDPGEHELKDSASANLDKLAEALRRRPRLQIEIRPVWSEADRRFFAKQNLNQRLKQHGGDPDNLLRSRRALEQLFDRELSNVERRNLLDRHTNQPEGSLSENLNREAYVEQLYGRLLEVTEVDSNKLNELAKRRAETVRSALRSRGISSVRLYVLDRKQIDETSSPVSLPLELSPNL